MSHESQIEYLTSYALFADKQADSAKDLQVRESWAKIASSCRHMAAQYRHLGKANVRNPAKP